MTACAALQYSVAAQEAANDPLSTVTPEQTHLSALATEFLNMIVAIARKKHAGGVGGLDAFRNRHISHMKDEHERFFTEVIRAIQRRIIFVSGRSNVTALGVNASGLPLRFTSQACRNLLIAVLPPDTDIPDERTDLSLKVLSDDALRAYITAFNQMDSPWLFFTALYVIGKRKLPARYIPH